MSNLTGKFFVPKIIFALLVLSGMAVFAAQNDTIGRALSLIKPEVKVSIAGNVQRDGESLSLERSGAVKPGEVLDWTISSANEGNGEARNYRVVGQIPKGTSFVAGSAKGEEAPNVLYSIDGGKSFSAQPMIEEKQADGSSKQVPAPVSMYSQLRFEWTKALAPQANFNASYRVSVK